MVIKYSAQAAGSYTTLGDDTTGATPPLIKGFAPRMVSIPQISPLFRARNAVVIGRGNRHWEVKGTIVTAHDSYAAALLFIQSQDAAIPDYIDLQIIQDGTTLYITPCSFASFDPLISGCESTITYGFIGSNITLTAP